MNPSSQTIAVLGAGRLGQAFLGRFKSEGRPLFAWDRETEVRASLRSQGYQVVDTLHEAAEQAAILLVTVPSVAFRAVMAELGPSARPDHVLLHATKGVAPGFKLMHELVREETCLQL